MSSSGPANPQAQALLQTLCKFILPLIQTALGQTIGSENFRFGIEADEFVIELEKFISGMISHSQSGSQGIAIEARLSKDSFYHFEEEEATSHPSSNDKGIPEHIPVNQGMIPHRAVSSSVPLGADEKALGNALQSLRKHVTQKMPIRLLCCQPENSKLKITLLDRAGIYNYLAVKLRAGFGSQSRWSSLLSSPDSVARYAILSHTWTQTPGELTYEAWQKGSLNATQSKCHKVVNFCKAAWENHGLTLGWVDTVCINKESSAELDESIRSMYAWYRDAEVCITYLAGSKIIPNMRNDPWFTRGWTLQELVAPLRIKFYNMDWNQLSGDGDDKKNRSIQAEITLATTITPDELQYSIWGTSMSISRRMQLAAKREVTREEDIAYCLMGIFDVSISTAYGEGAARAFFRLVEEILHSTKDVSSIFHWAGDRLPCGSRPPTTSLFPSHPSDYLNRSSTEQLRPWRPIEPLTLTHLGLRTPILLMPAVPILESDRPYPPPIGDYHANVSISLCARYLDNSQKLPKKFRLLDKRVSGPEGVYEVEQRWFLRVVKITLTFGTLNVEEQGTSIRIPKTCLAVLLEQRVGTSSPRYEKVYTKKPIVFNLKKTENNSNDDHGDEYYYQIERNQLARHGMQLVTLYL